MVTARAWRLVIGAAAAAAVGCGTAFWLTRPGPWVAPDQEQAYEMMPAITTYLDSQAYWPYIYGIVGSPAPDKPGHNLWLCSASVEEVRPDGAGWQVGMDVACADYFRQGAEIYEGIDGDMGHAVMVLSGDPSRYRVVSAEQEPGGPIVPGWVSQHFSAAAAAAINSGRTPVAALPNGDALRAFGCSATSSVYTGPDGPYWLCQNA
jgi:hypothetical protein